MQEIAGVKTLFGIGMGDGTYKAFASASPGDFPGYISGVNKVAIRGVDVLIYDPKNASGVVIPWAGWVGVGNSYYQTSGNDNLFCMVGPGRSTRSVQFPQDAGMSFPKSPADAPAIKLWGLVPATIPQFTYFVELTYTLEPLT
jgi:hypothetical protein